MRESLKACGFIALGAGLFSIGAKAPDFIQRQIGSLSNGGDDYPLLLSAAFDRGDMSHLAAGETVAVADGNGFAMARSDKVAFQLVEKIPVLPQAAGGGRDDDLASGIDLDGDGKPDVNGVGNKTMNFEVMKYAATGKNEYVQALTVEVAPGTKLSDIRTGTTFALVFINTGKATFTGRAVLMDHLDSRISIVDGVGIGGAIDMRRTNEALSWVPVLNLFSGGTSLKWGPAYDAGIFAQGRGKWERKGDILRVEIPGVTVKPGQGIAVTFQARIDWGKGIEAPGGAPPAKTEANPGS